MHEKYKKDIEAYADKEMDEDQSIRLGETLKNFPALQEYLLKLEDQKQILKQWWMTQKHH